MWDLISAIDNVHKEFYGSAEDTLERAMKQLRMSNIQHMRCDYDLDLSKSLFDSCDDSIRLKDVAEIEMVDVESAERFMDDVLSSFNKM